MENPKAYISRKRLLSFALMALVMGSTLGGALWNFGGVYYLKKQALSRFSSYQELVDFLKTSPQDMPQSLVQRFLPMFQPKAGEMIFISFEVARSALAEGQPSLTSGGGLDYSTTNIQVEGVDEADIVKTDGEFLYVVSGSTVYLLRAWTPRAQAELLSKLSFNTTVAGIFVRDNKLVVFRDGDSPQVLYRCMPYDKRCFPYYAAKTTLMVYDVSNKANPVMERNVTVDGRYFSSRLIDNYVYAVINKPAYLVNNTVVNLPEVRSGNHTIKIAATSIYHPELPDYYHFFTTIIAVNLNDAKQKPTVETFLLGATSSTYVSKDSIYLTAPGTNIHKISIKDGTIAYVANGLVSGYVLNQFSMDEYNGFFRIATSDGKSNNVFVLDGKLNIVGRLEGLAPGENLHSARFMGARAYLVTFKKVDPLFVIDLKNPQNPQVLGKLKIPGYSDYLHPYDETHLIGVGKETVEAEKGDFAWYQGVKLALFDVSNVSQPKEIAKIEIGDRGTDTPVLRDHKAFLFSRSRNLLVLPVLLAKIDKAKYPQGVPPSTQGEFVWQGAYVFDITLDKGFVLRGGVTHLDNAADLMKSGFYFSSPYSVKRALYIDDVLYTLSDKMVKMNSLVDLKQMGVVKLP